MNKSNNDYQTTSEELVTTVASISSNEIHVADSIANNMYTEVDIPEPYRVDVKPFVERPFYAGNVIFTTALARYDQIPSSITNLPGDVIRSNPSLLNAMKIGSLYRANLQLNITIAGTISHAGKVLAAILPPLPPSSIPLNGIPLINHALSGPHASLNANEATSVTLPVPWYCNSDLATLDMDQTSSSTLDIVPSNGNYATLVFIVMNPLSPSTGASQDLTITIEAIFKNLDVVVPTPRFVTWNPQSFGKAITGLKNAIVSPVKSLTGDFIDKAATTLFSWIGLHNPNIPTIAERDIITQRNFPNISDAPQFFEKLDPYTQFDRIVQSPIFGSDVDEMTTTYITNKKQFIGTFTVKSSDPLGTLYWVRPISPMQGGIFFTNNVMYCSNNIELMHSLHRAWRGDLEILVESVMNNKQNVRLRVLKMYNPTLDVISSTPQYASIANAPSSLLTYTAGGQEHVISLPYLCRNDLTPCSDNVNFEALFHGLYYIYLAQPLANSGDSPESIEFNVYIRGTPNLSFYGYPVKSIRPVSFGVLPTQSRNFTPQSNTIKVMNESQPQNDKISKDERKDFQLHSERLFKTPDLRSLIRRMYVPLKGVDSEVIDPGAFITQVIPLSVFLGEESFGPQIDQRATPISIISRMYYSKSVGFKFQLKQTDFSSGTSARNVTTTVYFVPPDFTYDPAIFTVMGAPVNPNLTEPAINPSYTVPLPLVQLPVTTESHTRLYEFTVPDVTFYKFMGSPAKFYDAASSTDNYSTSDFGSLYIRYTNLSSDRIFLQNTLMFGLTDESRLGHHCLASPFIIVKDHSPYLGSTEPKAPGIFYGGFLI